MVWLLGVVIFLLMMATAFMGYVLPWGQMSFWGAQVITGFFSAIPVVGEPLRQWLLGGFAPDQAALNRFFSLHYLLPFVIARCDHPARLGAAHSRLVEPDRRRVKSEEDTVPFHPYYTAKDGFGLGRFPDRSSCVLTFFAPNLLGHPDNYIPANPLSTPAHIVPEWYFWPFYAILRAFTGRTSCSFQRSCWACLRCSVRSCCCSSCLGWIHRRCVRAIIVRCSASSSGSAWSHCVVVLAIAACMPAEEPYVLLSQIAAAYYFAHFLIILPIVSRIEKPLAAAKFDHRSRHRQSRARRCLTGER